MDPRQYNFFNQAPVGPNGEPGYYGNPWSAIQDQMPSAHLQGFVGAGAYGQTPSNGLGPYQGFGVSPNQMTAPHQGFHGIGAPGYRLWSHQVAPAPLQGFQAPLPVEPAEEPLPPWGNTDPREEYVHYALDAAKEKERLGQSLQYRSLARRRLAEKREEIEAFKAGSEQRIREAVEAANAEMKKKRKENRELRRKWRREAADKEEIKKKLKFMQEFLKKVKEQNEEDLRNAQTLVVDSGLQGGVDHEEVIGESGMDEDVKPLEDQMKKPEERMECWTVDDPTYQVQEMDDQDSEEAEGRDEEDPAGLVEMEKEEPEQEPEQEPEEEAGQEPEVNEEEPEERPRQMQPFDRAVEQWRGSPYQDLIIEGVDLTLYLFNPNGPRKHPQLVIDAARSLDLFFANREARGEPKTPFKNRNSVWKSQPQEVKDHWALVREELKIHQGHQRTNGWIQTAKASECRRKGQE